jgi:hypothetical protein
MGEWTDPLSIIHEVAPGEAHTRLSLVEQRHAVLRKSIEVYMMDLDLHGPDGIRTALTYILPQLNAQPTVSGFSPAQWLLGYQPTVLLIVLTRSHRCICPVVPPSKKLCGGEVQQRRRFFKPIQSSDSGELCFVAMLVTTYGLLLARLVSFGEMLNELIWSRYVGKDLQKS